MNKYSNLICENKKDFINISYSVGLTFISIAFISLFYKIFIEKKNINIPKTFLFFYSLGGIFLIIQHFRDNNIYIGINETIGFLISIMILIFK